MRCGHRANATDSSGKECCAICYGSPEGVEISETPDLTGRIAKCTYCGSEEKSSIGLPFFCYAPRLPKDEYYCGCRGWD